MYDYHSFDILAFLRAMMQLNQPLTTFYDHNWLAVHIGLIICAFKGLLNAGVLLLLAI